MPSQAKSKGHSKKELAAYTREIWLQLVQDRQGQISVSGYRSLIRSALDDGAFGKTDLAQAMTDGEVGRTGLDSIKPAPASSTMVSIHTRDPEIDNVTGTNLVPVARAYAEAFERLKQELESATAPKTDAHQAFLDGGAGYNPRKIQQKPPTRAVTALYKQLLHWQMIQETALELKNWGEKLLKGHTAAVDRWTDATVARWKRQTIDSALLQECGRLDERILGAARLSYLELEGRRLAWCVRDLDPQSDMIRTIASTIVSFDEVWKDEVARERKTLARLTAWQRRTRHSLEAKIGAVSQEMESVKWQYSDRLLSNARYMSTASLEESMLERLKLAAQLTDDGFVEAYDRKIKRASQRLARQQEKEGALSALTKAKRRERASERLKATALKSRKRSNTKPRFSDSLMNLSMKDVVPLSTREQDEADLELDWVTIPISPAKPTGLRILKRFEGTYTGVEDNTFSDLLSRQAKRTYAENHFYLVRQKQAAQRAWAAQASKAQEQAQLEWARSQPEAYISLEQAKATTEETWCTRLPTKVRFDENTPWAGMSHLDLSVDYWLNKVTESMEEWRDQPQAQEDVHDRFERLRESRSFRTRGGIMQPLPYVMGDLISMEQDTALHTADLVQAIMCHDPVALASKLGRCDSLPNLYSMSMEGNPRLWNPYPDSDAEGGDVESASSETSVPEGEWLPGLTDIGEEESTGL